MGLTHSLFEDTLLMLTLGGHFSGLFWGRLGFTLVFTALLVQVASRLPVHLADKYLWGPPRERSHT